MADDLPKLGSKTFYQTRDHLQAAAHVISSLQRAFLPKHPRQWQYGLEVSMRGLSTQAFKVGDEEVRASLDLVRHKVRLAAAAWSLEEYSGPELFKNVQVWLESRGAKADLDKPKLSGGVQAYDREAGQAYAEALWWLDKQFRILKTEMNEGVTSPVLLYPHHFDLALSWFPWDDQRQMTLGWSTGDANIEEPYIYLTAYPESKGFAQLKLPAGCYWHTKGFSGAVLTYSKLRASSNPAKLLRDFAKPTLESGRQLLT